jgi:hypothetical protein
MATSAYTLKGVQIPPRPWTLPIDLAEVSTREGKETGPAGSGGDCTSKFAFVHIFDRVCAGHGISTVWPRRITPPGSPEPDLPEDRIIRLLPNKGRMIGSSG